MRASRVKFDFKTEHVRSPELRGMPVTRLSATIKRSKPVHFCRATFASSKLKRRNNNGRKDKRHEPDQTDSSSEETERIKPKIAGIVGMNKETVNNYVNKAKADTLSLDELLALEDAVLEHRMKGGNAAYTDSRLRSSRRCCRILRAR